MPVNEIGSPQLAPWTIAAFSTASQKRPQVAVDFSQDSKWSTASADAKRWHTESTGGGTASSRAEPHKADAKSTSEDTPPEASAHSVEADMKEYARSEMLQQVNSGHFQSELEIEAAFLYDWSRLRIDDLEKEPKEREAIQELLMANFAHTNAAYMHYAVGSGEMAYGMNGDEFAHFLHECGLCHFQNERKRLEKVVAQCLKHDCLVSPHDRGTLSRVGFLHALLRVVQSNSGGGAKDSNAALFKDAVEKSLKENIVPTVARLTSGPFRDHSHHDVRLHPPSFSSHLES